MSTLPNVPEFSVSDLAFSLKKTVESAYAHVRVRGELSRVSIAASGHMYSSLKDDGAVIDAVCWKGVMARLPLRPEEGLEVICTGKLSTFPKRSNYQLVIESMELAGEGALLKMLEDRKKKLASEGLFDDQRKKKIPKLPKVIGVVTSPTGAVIRDILHRLRDRMPSHVIVWPALVQGQGAAEQVAAGIEGLQNLAQQNLPAPDVIIVARGGGSLEDLMAFNEEIVVRAAADCTIPLISAVGHETDTTLIDYAADLRAPTPTGAAEMTVPVRADGLAYLDNASGRLQHATQRLLSERSDKLTMLEKSLGNPMQVVEMKAQMIDRLSDSLQHKMSTITDNAQARLHKNIAALKHPADLLRLKQSHLERWAEQLSAQQNKLFEPPKTRLDHAGKMLEAFSFQNVLKRGFTVIRSEDGQLVTTPDQAQQKDAVNIEFYGGHKISARLSAHPDPSAAKSTRVQTRKTVKPPKTKKNELDNKQESLF